ncbi:sensor histidine kinase [Gynuella sunshinyii]|uniref:histidine kinase n=1 Tax=Gynuella sunshinyii YC6258 TaxID=1445510 RepID=A0A0C5VF27_9GAMM|nr:sensor histidine kinase [Gynuella sunshinyii]AJQ97870.1 signal transduction histidine kinase [Gynuella sunshinyii YC6258]
MQPRKPDIVSQWDHDVFPVLKKSLTIWFLIQFVVSVIMAIILGRLEDLYTYRIFFPISLLALIFFLSAPVFQRWFGSYYPLVFIAILLLIPAVMINTRFWLEPQTYQRDVFIDFYHQIPFLFVAMIFTAWFYRHKGVLLFSVLITLIDLPLFWFRLDPISENHEVWYLLCFRLIIILFIGHVMAGMVKYAHEQGNRLAQSNTHLLNYHETLEQLAANRERASMARELHDTLAHSLTALTVQLEVTKALIEADPQQAKTAVQTALDTARDGLKETRFALQNLRSGRIEQMGLVTGLNKLLTELGDSIDVDVSLPDETDINKLDQHLQNTLYRIAQEAIHNVKKHANASHLSLRMECDFNRIYLEIRDDGRGFNLTDHDRDCFGIKGMKERAMLARGELAVISRPEKGTRVVATFAIE